MSQSSNDDDPIGAVSAESLGFSLHTGVRRRRRSDFFKKSQAGPAPEITKRTARGPTVKLTKQGQCQTPSGAVVEWGVASMAMPSTDPMNLSPERGASDSVQAAEDISSSRSASSVGHLLDCCVAFVAGYICAVSIAILHYVS